MKSIQLTQSQINRIDKAEKGETIMFIVPIDTKGMKMSEIGLKKDLLQYAPIQKGDKDIFIQEEFFWIEQTKESIFKDMFFNGKITLNETYDINDFDWNRTHPSKMTKEQSRYTISECIESSVVRVQELTLGDIKKFNLLEDWQKMEMIGIKDFYNTQLKEHNINRTYDDNDYIILLEVKR